MKKEMSLLRHISYILCLAVFTFPICLGFFLFSFSTLLSFFNYPLVHEMTASPFLLAFSGSTLSCILPPLFLIGMVRSYGFKERLVRMLEVQSFFFILLVTILSAFIFYTVQLEDNVRAVMNAHYFAVLSRIGMCLYFYLSIKICMRSQNMPLPLYPMGMQGEFTIIEPVPNEPNEIDKIDEPDEIVQQLKDTRILGLQIKKVWEKYQREIPYDLKATINFAQVIGFALVGLTFIPLQNVPVASFLLNYSFLSVFFLYFYLLYQMKKRSYTLWRFAYLCLNIYLLVAYGLHETMFWQIVLLVFFLCQCFVFYNIFWKNKTWFVS